MGQGKASMEPKRRTPNPPTGLLVHTWHDNFVSRTSAWRTMGRALNNFRIALPWFFVREVPIDIELVSTFESNSRCFINSIQNTSLHRRSLLSASNVGCNKAFWGALVAHQSGNTMPLASSRELIYVVVMNERHINVFGSSAKERTPSIII